MTILKILKMVLKKYNEVLKDSVFGIIVAINEHNHGYSEKVIHSFIYKQLIIFKLRVMVSVCKEVYLVFNAIMSYCDWTQMQR